VTRMLPIYERLIDLARSRVGNVAHEVSAQETNRVDRLHRRETTRERGTRRVSLQTPLEAGECRNSSTPCTGVPDGSAG
jgi:hypothetical protein